MKRTFVFLIIIFFGLSFDRLNIFKYCIVSSIWHEIGHISAYKICTGKMPEIDVSVFGFKMKNNVLYHDNYVIILLSGPFTNFLLAAASFFLVQNQFKLNLYVFMIVNTILFIYNILPVYYLDGGQVLYSVSLIYQRFHRQISCFFIIFTVVMLIYFTGSIAPIFISAIYFIINIINDI